MDHMLLECIMVDWKIDFYKGRSTMNKRKIILLLAALIFIISIGSGAVNAKAKKAKKPVLSNKQLTLKVGAKKQLRLKNAKQKKVTWKSKNKSVASVKKGLIKAKKKGNCRIIATYNKKKYFCKVTVKKNKKKIKKGNTDNPTPTPEPPIQSDEKRIDTRRPILSQDQVKFEIQSYDKNQKEITCVLTNLTGLDIRGNYRVELEKYEEGQWFDVDNVKMPAMLDIAVLIKKNDVYTCVCNLDDYGTLESGRYRVVYGVTVEDMMESKVVAEFDF